MSIVDTPHRRTPLVLLLVANAISLTGNMLSLIALPWFVLQTTGSATKTGLTGVAVTLPTLLVGLFGGVLVDRLGYKRTSVIADIVSGVGVAAIPLLYHTIGLAFWQLLMLVFIGALLDIPGLSARRSMLPELAALAGTPLERVNALLEGNQRLASLLGPPIAAGLIVMLGANNVLWVDALTFVISAALVGGGIPTITADESSEPDGGYLADLVAGLRVLWNDRILLTLAVSLAISSFIDAPLVAVVLPVYADAVFASATAFGLIVAAFGAGSLTGVLFFGVVGHRLRRRPLWIGSYLISALGFWILTIYPPLWLILVGFVVSGIAVGPINPLLVTIWMERIPPAMRGRVFSTFSAVAMGAAPLGILLTGTLIDALGLRLTLIVLAGLYQAVGVVMFIVPALHLMEASRHTSNLRGQPSRDDDEL